MKTVGYYGYPADQICLAPLVFVNKVLLEHSYAPFILTLSLATFSYNRGDKSLRRQLFCTEEPKIFTLWSFAESVPIPDLKYQFMS